MKTKKYFILAAAALSLAACSSDNDVTGGKPVAARVTASIDGIGTRAHDAVWDANDAIGISTTGYTNVQYTTTGDGNFTAASNGILFQSSSDSWTFSAYYPYNAAGGTISTSTSDQSAQKSFDFLYASGATASYSNPTVSFTGAAAFQHKMARLDLQIQAGAGVSFGSSAAFALKGLKLNGTFNTADGTATATGEAGTDWWTVTPNSGTCSLILFPQTVNSLQFQATVGEDTYTCTLSSLTLSASNKYTYTITVSKTGINVSGCTISDWGDCGSSSGTATM